MTAHRPYVILRQFQISCQHLQMKNYHRRKISRSPWKFGAQRTLAYNSPELSELWPLPSQGSVSSRSPKPPASHRSRSAVTRCRLPGVCDPWFWESCPHAKSSIFQYVLCAYGNQLSQPAWDRRCPLDMGLSCENGRVPGNPEHRGHPFHA